MKRQGIITTVFELRLLADELESQMELDKLELGIGIDLQRKFQLNVINKEGLSDTWEFEKTPKP